MPEFCCHICGAPHSSLEHKYTATRLESAKLQGLECFFLTSAEESKAFAEHLHKHTSRETHSFTEVYQGFPLYIATLEPRRKPCQAQN